MLKQLVKATTLTAACCVLTTTERAIAQTATFQDGADGYGGTQDTEFRTDAVTTPVGELPIISVDQADGTSAGGQAGRTQAAIRFDNIFVDEGGLVPRDEVIQFAEVVFWVESQTARDAVISLDRILSGDYRQDGLAFLEGGSVGEPPAPGAVWTENDTWDSLGGSTIPVVDPGTGNVILEFDPIIKGDGLTPAPDNESAAAPEDSINAPFDGILESQFNTVQDDFVSIEVTNSIRQWQAGAQNFGWAINSTSGNGWDFASSDFAVDAFPEEDQAGVQSQLDLFGVTELEIRPRLNVVFGVQGDLDFDGDIDEDDYIVLNNALGMTVASRGELADLDFDSDVDLDDFAAFKTLFDGMNGAGSFAAMVAGVPEPGSFALVGGVALALGLRRRSLAV